MDLIAVVVVLKAALRVSPRITAYVGLGSNLQQPIQQLRDALVALLELPETRQLCSSSFYASKPMGPQDQPDYVNAVAQLETTLSPLALLHALQQIENQQGRVRQRRWGERTLDLDLLLYGDQLINFPELVVPHIGLAERNFVLYPLYEIVPELDIPQLGPLKQLLDFCPRGDLQLLQTS